MSLVSLKNGIVKALKSDDAQSQQGQKILNPNTTTTSYNATDRGDSLGDEEENIQSTNTDSDGKTIDEHYNEDTGILGKVDPRVMSDIVIGLSDGLTVPFALTAGLSSLGDSKLVITGGVAELVSGAISMGLGGYLAAKSELDFFKSEYKTEKQKLYSNINEVNHEIEDILLDINSDFSDETIVSFIRDLKKHPKLMLDFVVRYGKGLEEPAANRQVTSALTIGSSYFLGGFVPLIPYFFVAHVDRGLVLSTILMGFTLFWFGFLKAQISLGLQCSTGKKVSEGLQMVLVGGIAAGSAWFLVRAIG